MDSAVHGLPPSAASAAHESVVGAGAVAERLGGAAGRALHQAASVAFVDSMQVAMLVAAAVVMAGSVLALVLLPARDRDGAAAIPAIAPPLHPEPVAA